MTTAIIIVNYHSQDLVCECLTSLGANVKSPYRVVVVDNSEKADTDKIALRFPDAVVIRSPGNVGFAGGCNIGIRYALGKDIPFLLLLNPDTRAEMDFLAPMLAVMESQPRFGMLGPKIFHDDGGREIWNCGGELNWWLGGQRRLLADPPPGQSVQAASYLSGCAMLLRSEAVREVGLMDERYFLYFEDSDYVQAFLHADWQVGYVHAAELYHRVSATTEVHSPRYVYYFARNRMLFMRKWSRPGHLFVFCLYTLLIKGPAAWLYFGLLRRRPELARRFWGGLLAGGKGGAGPLERQ